MSRIRVQFVISTLEVGGAENQMTALAVRLDPEQFDIEVLVLTRTGPMEERLKDAGIPVLVLGKKPGFDPASLRKISGHIRRFRPHILHSWLFTAGAFARTVGVVCRVPVLIHSERSVDLFRTRIKKWIDRSLFRWSDVVVSNSSAVAEWFASYAWATPKRLEIIHNGLDLTQFEVPNRQGRTGPVVIMNVCRISAAKRLDLLMKAVAQLHEQGVAFEMHIVGDGELREELESQIKALGIDSIVRLLGVRFDVPRCLQAADVFVQSSDVEGLPNGVMEGMAAGLPVVATRAGGTADLVTPGENGFLVDTGDWQGLASHLKTLIEDAPLRLQMGEVSRAHVAANFTMERMVQAHEALFKRLV